MMKKILGIFLVFQMLCFNIPALNAAELPLNSDNNDIQPLKICCKDANGNEIPYPSGGGISGGAITGIVMGSVAGAVVLGMAARRLLEGSKFDNISIFDTGNPVSSLDVKGVVSNNKMLSKALNLSMTNDTSSGEKPVALFTPDTKEVLTGDDKVIVLSDSEIRDKTLHLYSVKLPPELWNSSKKINVEAAIVFDSPAEVMPDNNTHNINIRLFNSIKPEKIATIISNHNYNYLNEHRGIIKVSDINLVSDSPDRQLYTIEKEFHLNKSYSQKPLTFAVSCLRHLKKKDQDYPTNYAVVLRIKNQ